MSSFRVSIPFIAGQWSLLCSPRSPHGGRRSAFQSPSLRGSGRFSSSPLRSPYGARRFQSPSLRGSGRFERARRIENQLETLFQSPSLRGSGRFLPPHGGPPLPSSRFNPLHCGAVVASAAVWRAWREAAARFNPLHCGAVVASPAQISPRRGPMPVSIPFIAGQWSLPPAAWRRGKEGSMFQSPSLRGSGRFGKEEKSDGYCLYVSIPFIAGQWSLLERLRNVLAHDPVSIPFIAGQWSLLVGVRAMTDHKVSFQSPSLRGSGRFYGKWLSALPLYARFNPLHCGAVVASFQLWTRSAPSGFVSIPFIAGQWSLRYHCVYRSVGAGRFQSPSLRGSGRFKAIPAMDPERAKRRFNPLHCGAVVASGSGVFAMRGTAKVSIPFIAGQWSLHPVGTTSRGGSQVSIPFIAGQWSLHDRAPPALILSAVFQSPSLRGSGRFSRPRLLVLALAPSFNPLHCGAVVASGFAFWKYEA